MSAAASPASRAPSGEVHTLVREHHVDASPEEVFAFFGDALNLQRITPPWLGFRLLTPTPIAMAPGTRIEYRLRLHGLPLRWLTEITVWEPPVRFVDLQLRGPYRLWHHTHSFVPEGDGVRVRDVICYALAMGALGQLVDAAFVRRDLARIFDYRQQAVASILGRDAPSAQGPRSRAG